MPNAILVAVFGILLGRTQIHLDADTLALFPSTAQGPTTADVALANAIYGRPRQNPFNLPLSFAALAVLIACGTTAAWKRGFPAEDKLSLCILALVLINSFVVMEPHLAPLMRNSGTAGHLYTVGLAHVCNYALCYLGLVVNFAGLRTNLFAGARTRDQGAPHCD